MVGGQREIIFDQFASVSAWDEHWSSVNRTIFGNIDSRKPTKFEISVFINAILIKGC